MQENSKGKKLTNKNMARAKESRQRAAHVEKQAEAAEEGTDTKRGNERERTFGTPSPKS
jgi:hypothetical protein